MLLQVVNVWLYLHPGNHGRPQNAPGNVNNRSQDGKTPQSQQDMSHEVQIAPSNVKTCNLKSSVTFADSLIKSYILLSLDQLPHSQQVNGAMASLL